uniref:Uncharacterized protein n=1 Tax=Anguilla anguilla TaxID=7936 RepID=A0A0E9SMV2_ANGAN
MHFLLVLLLPATKIIAFVKLALFFLHFISIPLQTFPHPLPPLLGIALTL